MMMCDEQTLAKWVSLRQHIYKNGIMSLLEMGFIVIDAKTKREECVGICGMWYGSLDYVTIFPGEKSSRSSRNWG